ncbi:pyridoxamine 5'-phosphate oxidase [Rhodococcus sp. WMMA185]|nr:pyridoxamine 5'-phosphate oxidase [Rhodococcus sp. WMMA185]
MRYPDRARTERAELDAVLDAAPMGTLATVVDGMPWAVPMLYARDGDRILLHGSTGAGALRHVAAGAPAVLCVAMLDGIVVAETLFDSSANYRSAVVRGNLVTLDEDDSAGALSLFSDALIPGRSREVREFRRKELAATLALALPISSGQWTVKVRDAPPSEPAESSSAWAGVVPLRSVAGAPVPAPWVTTGTPVPASVARLVE